MKQFRIPFSGRSHLYTQEEIDTVVDVMQNASPLTQGEYQQKFQDKFCKYIGSSFSFALNNATAGLEIAAQLCQFEQGDEVIIPGHTFTASAYPFIKNGAKIVWSDIDIDTRVVTNTTIEKCITPKTKAIVVVHLYGYGADMTKIMELAKKYNVLGNKRQWNSILKKFNSNYEDLLESYNNLYTLRTRDKNKINLSEAFQNSIGADFVKSLNKQGIPCGDMNYSNEENCGPIFNTIRRYFRTSVLTLIKEKNFKQRINENVESLLVNNDQEVIGVKTSLRNIYSDYVILSGGVVGTCDFLLREKIQNF